MSDDKSLFDMPGSGQAQKVVNKFQFCMLTYNNYEQDDADDSHNNHHLHVGPPLFAF